MRAAVTAGGYEAVTIEGLAADAEVSKQTIYRWWPSKAAILGEALLEGSFPGADVDVPYTEDLEADLRAWFSAMSARLADAEGVAIARALIAVTATNPELGVVLNERLAAPVRDWVVGRLALGIDAGEVRTDVDAEVVADQFVAMGSYAALVGIAPTQKRLAAVVDAITRGLGSVSQSSRSKSRRRVG